MAARKVPNIQNYFSSAKQSQQLSSAEEEIQKLKAEIEELRNAGSQELEAQLAELRSQLQAQSGILNVSLDQIEPNPEQPRQTFLGESIDSMSRSLDKDGQLQPIILVQRDKLVLFDGERRWRSAKALGWKTLQAVVIPEPDALHRKALLTSLHREDLNPLDKAEAIVREIESNTDVPAFDIPRILSTAVRRLGAQKRMNEVVELITAPTEEQQQGLSALALDEKERAVFSVLLDLQLNPSSVDANIFPMLSLAEDLKAAIREQGLKGVHAIALAKLSPKNLGASEAGAREIRTQATQRVIQEKLSASQTRKLVTEVIATQAKSDSTGVPTKTKPVAVEARRLQKLSIESLKSADPEQLVEFQEVLRQKLAEIEAVLKEK